MNRADLQALADVRIEEARGLLRLRPPRPDGAYYLAGYAVECALKAAIAKLVKRHDWPDKAFLIQCHTHRIVDLVRYAGLLTARDTDMNANPVRAQNWTTVEAWSEHSRYERHSLDDAKEMVSAVADNTNGVLPWIKDHW